MVWLACVADVRCDGCRCHVSRTELPSEGTIRYCTILQRFAWTFTEKRYPITEFEMRSFCFVLPLPLLILLHSTIAFQNHAAMTTNQPHCLRDGSHNHPYSTYHKQDISSSREHDRDLRDGSHNHPVPNTLSAIEARLAALDLVLPPPGGPKANYVS